MVAVLDGHLLSGGGNTFRLDDFGFSNAEVLYSRFKSNPALLGNNVICSPCCWNFDQDKSLRARDEGVAHWYVVLHGQNVMLSKGTIIGYLYRRKKE